MGLSSILSCLGRLADNSQTNARRIKGCDCLRQCAKHNRLRHCAERNRITAYTTLRYRYWCNCSCSDHQCRRQSQNSSHFFPSQVKLLVNKPNLATAVNADACSMLLARFKLSLFGENQNSLSMYSFKSLRLIRHPLPINLAFSSPEAIASLRNSLDKPVKACASAIVSSSLSEIATFD